MLTTQTKTPVLFERSLTHGLGNRLGTRIKRLTGNQPPKLLGQPPKLEKAWRPEKAWHDPKESIGKPSESEAQRHKGTSRNKPYNQEGTLGCREAVWKRRAKSETWANRSDMS